MRYVVTVKIRRQPNHDPHNEVTGPCPVGNIGVCTDATGEHHSFMQRGVGDESAADVKARLEAVGYHVTRVEGVE